MFKTYAVSDPESESSSKHVHVRSRNRTQDRVLDMDSLGTITGIWFQDWTVSEPKSESKVPVVSKDLCPLATACHTWRCPCISVVLEAIYEARLQALEGRHVSIKKSPSRVWDQSEGVAGRNRRAQCFPDEGSLFCPSSKLKIFYLYAPLPLQYLIGCDSLQSRLNGGCARNMAVQNVHRRHA